MSKIKQLIHIGIIPGECTGMAFHDPVKMTITEITSQPLESCFGWILEKSRFNSIRLFVENNGSEAFKRFKEFILKNRLDAEFCKSQKTIKKNSGVTLKRVTGYRKKTDLPGAMAALLVFGR